jgi:predicted esterase
VNITAPKNYMPYDLDSSSGLAKTYEIDQTKGQITLNPPSGTPHKYTLIFLHGLDDTAETYKTVFSDERVKLPASCKVILPTAPKRNLSALS